MSQQQPVDEHRAFWIEVRRVLLILLKAVERYKLGMK